MICSLETSIPRVLILFYITSKALNKHQILTHFNIHDLKGFLSLHTHVSSGFTSGLKAAGERK